MKSIDFRVNPKIKDRFFYFKEGLEKFRFDNIAGALQEFTEIRIVEWFKNIYLKFKVKNFIFSGGVANNVKANKILLDQNFVESLWVPQDQVMKVSVLVQLIIIITKNLDIKKHLHI